MATATGAPTRLGAEEIKQIRRWAVRVGGAAADERLRRAAHAVVRLSDEALRARSAEAGDDWEWGDDAPAPTLGPGELEEARRFAGRVGGNGAGPEHRAAARAILLLCDDLAAGAAAVPHAASDRPPPALTGQHGPSLVSPLNWLSTAVAIVLGLILVAIMTSAAPDLHGAGPSGLVGGAQLRDLELSIQGEPSLLRDARWTVDGKDVTGQATREGDRLVLRPKLGEGGHEVAASVGGVALWSAAREEWPLVVDTTPPSLGFPSDLVTAPARQPFVLSGKAAGAESLAVDGKAVELGAGGSFTVRRPEPPAKLLVEARDAAGNVSRRELTVELAPRLPAAPVRAVHVSADAWASDELRAGVLDLIRERKANAVELDLKDESGVVGWNAPVPLARKAGAVQDVYDLGAAVKQLHDLGVRVIGRLVVFRDPKLAAWAWKAKKRDMVIQTPQGKPYTGGYDAFASFTNLASPEVRDYNVAIGVAAAKLGVDDVLYDYIRRPDGPLDTMVFPKLKGSPEDAIVSFLAQTREALAPTKTFLGVSVFGIAATRPDEIAQDVPRMAREVDYVAPMVYPSHWAEGEYGVANPNAQPYDIVLRSLEDFKRAVRGTGARLVPWLQDFSLGVDYGPAEVRAQIQGARDAGLHEWLLWDPAVTYTTAGIPGGATLPTVGEKPVQTSFVTVPALPPNELGEIPVLMYHQVVAENGGEYDVTPAQLREELERLYREGYRPITASQLASGEIDVPKGTTPVVLTFDDGTASQAALRPDGTLDPATAAGIILQFSRTHPGFEPRATFYVNRDPFAAGDKAGALIRVLREHGFELGNHTRDHANLSELSDAAVQEQFVSLERLVRTADPQAELPTMALPFGVMPGRKALALHGSFDGDRYAFTGVMLVGAEPAPSPYGRAWNPAGIPRIRATLDPGLEYGFTYWLDRLAEKPAARFVSDGDPQHITVPETLAGRIAPAYADRVQTR